MRFTSRPTVLTGRSTTPISESTSGEKGQGLGTSTGRVQATDPRDAVRCPNCHTKLAESLTGQAVFTCRRCKAVLTIRRNLDKPTRIVSNLIQPS